MINRRIVSHAVTSSLPIFEVFHIIVISHSPSFIQLRSNCSAFLHFLSFFLQSQVFESSVFQMSSQRLDEPKIEIILLHAVSACKTLVQQNYVNDMYSADSRSTKKKEA